MTAPINPPIIAKASLVTARTVDKAFAVPMDMTNGALAVAGSTHSALGAINAAAAEGYHALVPRGPAKLLEKLFAKVDQSIVGSAAQAKQATTVFWAPFSEGSVKTGTAVSNPFALFYANRAGFEMPADPAEAQALLSAIKHPDPYVRWPTNQPAEEAPPAEGGKTPPPAEGGETKPPTDGGETPPPAEGGETNPPTDGGETPPPAEGGETKPPAEGDAAPTSDGAGTPPAGDAAPETKPEGDAGTSGAGASTGAAAGASVVAEDAGPVAAVADAAAGASAVPATEAPAAPAAATAPAAPATPPTAAAAS